MKWIGSTTPEMNNTVYHYVWNYCNDELEILGTVLQAKDDNKHIAMTTDTIITEEIKESFPVSCLTEGKRLVEQIMITICLHRSLQEIDGKD